MENNESIKEEKKEESDNYEISEKENNTKVDVYEKRMENYAANFIKVNTLNQMNNIKEDKNLVNIKKSKFGITDIKVLKKLAIFLNFIWILLGISIIAADLKFWVGEMKSNLW